MAVVNSKTGLCNLAVSHLGSGIQINSIDTPKTKPESTCAIWYDVTRRKLLKLVMPNFALQRRIVGQLATDPAFGWGYAYEYPSDCLKLLGIGEVQHKQNDYAIETISIGNAKRKAILTNKVFDEGMKIRILADVTDVNAMDDEFKILFSLYLAVYICLPITQSLTKRKEIQSMLPSELVEVSGLNAQENRPIRISYSRFKDAKFTLQPTFQTKK